MKKISIKLALLTIAINIVSCTKSNLETNETSANNLPELTMLSSSNSFNKAAKSVTVTIGGTTVTSIICKDEGKNCKVTKHGVDIKHELESLNFNIINGNVNSFFQGSDWPILFPELSNTQVLINLQQGNLTMYKINDGSGDSIYICAAPNVNIDQIQDSQIVFATIFE